MKYRILVVDDNDGNIQSTRLLLEEWGFQVDTANSGENALRVLTGSADEYAVALLDYRMPGLNGAQVASRLQKIRPDMIVLMYSCDDSREALKYSLKAGALDFIEKDSNPLILKDTLDLACQRFEETARLYQPTLDKSENCRVLREIGLVGQSDKMAEIASRCLNYRDKTAPVLLLGETGVGKELVAKAIHGNFEERFFAVNCAAFADSQLTESELFGYEKGAFTGASTRKSGILEVAGTGTVFLDEVDKLGVRAQGTLLRALREKKIRRVGAFKETPITCRIIAAAKPDLLKRVEAGTFLPDLYYRLNFLCIEIPPLRQRSEDIGLLIQHICLKYERETGVKRSFRAQAVRLLERYPWPGNVGELEACISGLLVDTKNETIDIASLDTRFQEGSEVSDLPVTLADLDTKYEADRRKLITLTLRESGSQRRAAARLGINESSLRTIVSRIGLESRRLEVKSSRV